MHGAAAAVDASSSSSSSSASGPAPAPPLARRATNRAPKGYTPSRVDCPRARPAIRRGGGAQSAQERAWLARRRNATLPALRGLLRRVAIPGFDSDGYLRDAEGAAGARRLPVVGLAVSGGGYRAMLTGAGALAAWDARADGSQAAGNLGGLLQSAAFLSGLSGGGWLVGSLFANNFTSVPDAASAPAIWQLGESILKGPHQYSLLQYYSNILDDVDAKAKAGFDCSLTDYWGRMLSYQLINAPDGGPGFTFSSIADDADFAAARTPLPLLVADGRAPGEVLIAANSTVFEFSPWELGSSDASLDGFVPLRYVGSKFRNGSLPDGEACIAGFDNAGFVMGTSSSLFNQVVLYLKDGNAKYVPPDVPRVVVDALASVLKRLGDKNNDIADWTPNPFKGYNPANNPGAGADRLTLVDGGEDGQNIPYHPHLLRARGVDVVFSVDSSADTDKNWPDGASVMATYRRALAPGATAGFPVVPGTDTFRNLGLNTRPVFFGCDGANTTGDSGSGPAPLVVYLPNHPYVYHSNISTFQMSVEPRERDAIIENGWAVVTQLNSTRDPDWPVCVGCAILARSWDRTATQPPAKCRQCFARYCWDGRLDEAQPKPYDPPYVGKPIGVESAGSPPGRRRAMAAAAATATTVMAVLAFAV